VFEKLPAFFACAVWMAASGFELPLEQPASERARAVARSVLDNSETERMFMFIFMTTDWPLGKVAKTAWSRGGSVFFRRRFVSQSGRSRERGYLGGYPL